MIGFAVIGCGGAGGRRLADLLERPGVEVRALCDSSPRVCAALALSHPGLLITGDAERAINERGVECVIIATPPSTHAALAAAALAAGRHVLVEKPLAGSIDEGVMLAATAQTERRVLHTASNHRYFPPIEAGRALCESGVLGTIRRVRARIGHDGARLRSWAHDPAIAVGGALLDNGIHLADLLIWWRIGGQQVKVRGVREPGDLIERAAGGRLEFAGGPTVQVWASWRVRGDYLVMALDGDDGSMWLRVGRSASLEVSGKHTERREFTGRFNTWSRDLDAFLAEVRGEAPPRESDRSDGVAPLLLIDALYRSAAAGTAESVLLP